MKFFEGYIGQKQAVDHASEVCNATAEGRHIPFQPVNLTGHAGLGKSLFMDLFAENLSKASGSEFESVEINSATSLPVFLGIWVNRIEGKKAVIKIDEVHALSKKLGNFLKPILETNRAVKQIRYDDYVITANPFEHLWIAASNEEPKDTALFGGTGRFETVQFVPYSQDEMKAMIAQKADKWAKDGKMKINGDAVNYLVTRCLPNARAISQLVESDCLLHGGTITLAVAKEICVRKGRYPMGLRREDIITLQFVGKDEKGRQVNEIAAACGGEDARTTSYRLQWLAGYGFIQTNAGKKYLTLQGKEYLTKLADSIRRAKAAK